MVVSGDKDLCTTMINKSNYKNEFHETINDEIHRGIYKVIENKTLDDVKNFASF